MSKPSSTGMARRTTLVVDGDSTTAQSYGDRADAQERVQVAPACTGGIHQFAVSVDGCSLAVTGLHSGISKRAKLPHLPNKGPVAHLVIVATGLKVYGEGKWKVRKLHLAVDAKTGVGPCQPCGYKTRPIGIKWRISKPRWPVVMPIIRCFMLMKSI